MPRRNPSEWQLLVEPAIGLVVAVAKRLHWLMALLLIVYMGSNVRRIQPDEVAVVLRFGGVESVHEAGLLLAWPKPIDEVVVLPVEKVFEVDVRDLHHRMNDSAALPFLRTDMGPANTGYVLTADHNILHVAFVARYSIADPIAFVFQNDDPEKMLQTMVGSEATQAAGSMAIDDMLTSGRSDLVSMVKTRVQSRLDKIQAGIKLVSLELSELGAPRQISSDFTAVQSAEIESQTKQRRADEYKAAQLPRAKAAAMKMVRDAKANSRRLLAQAKADTDQFKALAKQAKENPDALKIRLYREGMEKALSDVGELRFVPPPVGLQYDDRFRLSIKAGAK